MRFYRGNSKGDTFTSYANWKCHSLQFTAIPATESNIETLKDRARARPVQSEHVRDWFHSNIFNSSICHFLQREVDAELVEESTEESTIFFATSNTVCLYFTLHSASDHVDDSVIEIGFVTIGSNFVSSSSPLGQLFEQFIC